MMAPGTLVRASGTLTLDTVIATDVFVVGDITYTMIATPASGYDIDVGASDTVIAASSASAVNKDGSGSATTYYETDTIENPAASGSSSGAVLTLTARVPGSVGNSVVLNSVDSTITASAANLESGTGVLEDALDSLMDEVQLNSEAISMIAHLTSRSTD